MKQFEKDEIRELPSKYKPIGAWGYFGLNILFSLPVIGLICLIVFACSSKNIVRRSYARSFFCGLIIAVVILAVVLILAFTVGKEFMAQYLEMFKEMIPAGQ